jgi:hypothetical protein
MLVLYRDEIVVEVLAASPSGLGVREIADAIGLDAGQGSIMDRTFETAFLDSGVEAYVFTFG